MTRSLGRRAGAVVLLTTALFAVLPASPAAAEPVISVEQPRDGQTYESATVSFSGRVTNNSPLHNVKRVTLAAAGETKTIDCNDPACPFSWEIRVARNGPYELRVTATEAAILLGTPGATATRTRGFGVAAPPAKPALDPPQVNEARDVELSWSRNAEPDILYYAVFRRDPGRSNFERVGGDVAQPRSGTKVRYTDTQTSAFNGGDYAYLVVAVRPGADGTEDTKVTSDPSGTRTAPVPPPPTSSTSTPPPGSPAADGGSPTTTARPGSAAGVDLSGFLSSRSQPAPVAPITIPEPPDTGFEGTLPFGAIPPGEELEEGEPDAVPPRGRGSTSSVVSTIESGRPLVPVAGGLVLLLLAVHMRLLNRRVKPVAAGGDLPVEPSPAPAPAPAPVPAAEAPAPPPAGDEILEEEEEEEDWAPVDEEPEPVPVPVPAAEAPALYDVLEDEGWLEEEDWAPPVEEEPEPEPEPEPVALWAPSEPDGLGLDEPVDVGEIAPGQAPAPALEEEIEVFEVVSPTRRRLAPTGTR